MIHIFDMNEYIIEKTYIRDGKKCYLDIVRNILIPATPEEEVRQKVLLFLINKMEIPLEMIRVEVPMCYFEERKQGRADIIVFEMCEDELLRPVLLVECKSQTVQLTNDVWEQAYKYNEILNCYNVMVVNGNNFMITSWRDDKNEYDFLAQIPKYSDIVNKENLLYSLKENIKWKRPSYDKIFSQEIYKEFTDEGWLGVDTSKELYPFIINLVSLFQDENDFLKVKEQGSVEILEDCGIRYSGYGNAGGGNWIGLYRYFIIKDKNKNNQIISFSVIGSNKFENDAIWGNRKGNTTLVVAIDDYDKKHNSLQLNLDKYIKQNGKQFTIWHDGKIAVGNQGSSKKDEVIKFIEKNAPELLDDEKKISLGSFDNRKEILWEQEETKKFISNLIKYALIRDEFRRYKKNS